MHQLQEMLSGPHVNGSVVGAYLDELPPDQRRLEALSLTGEEQSKLFHLAKGLRPMTIDDLVPAEVGVDQEVVHHGRNSLPAFSAFAKVFMQPSEISRGELWGYNRTTDLVTKTVGPGYFRAYQHHEPGELLVDYLVEPPRGLSHWPDVIPNGERLSRFVYYGTQDILRGVSRHVSIGRATREGKDLPNYFVLCREG